MQLIWIGKIYMIKSKDNDWPDNQPPSVNVFLSLKEK